MTTTEGPFTPPYFSFATFWSFIERLSEKPLPPRIDRSMMENVSGANQAYILSAMRGFGLISDTNAVLPRLMALTSEGPARKQVLGDIIYDAYRVQMAVSQLQGTESQLLESFAEYQMRGETRRKAVTFFLHAAREAGIPLSPHFPVTRSVGGAAQATATKRRVKRRQTATTPETKPEEPAAAGSQFVVRLPGATLTIHLTMDPFALSRENRDAILTLIDQAKQLGSTQTEAML
jgi:hypothetical protein